MRDDVDQVVAGHLRHAREQMDAARGLLVKAMQMDLTVQAKNTIEGLKVASEWIKKQEEKRSGKTGAQQ